MDLEALPTPALVVDGAALDRNLAAMAAVLPGERLRPHVKAHKTTSLARRQAAVGHLGFTCATIREVEGMAAAGLGHDLLLANEVVHAGRLGAVADGTGARVTLAVDSEATVASESTASVTLAPPASASAPRRRASTTSLASSRSAPRPAAAMPSTSRMVAQVKPRCPASAWRRASAVVLCALTWGRSRGPGRAAAMVAMFRSRAPASTTRAGVATEARSTTER